MRNNYTGLCYASSLRAAGAAATELYDAALAPAGINVTQYRLLANLETLEQANVTHWAERVGVERSTMVRNIKLLENAGWVELTAGHGKTYRLTTKGAAVLEAARPLWKQTQQKIIALLGEEDAAAVFRIRDKLQEAASGL